MEFDNDNNIDVESIKLEDYTTNSEYIMLLKKSLIDVI